MKNNGLKILIIEDQKFSTDLFLAAFSQYNILVASSGVEGVVLYQKDRPDMVFLDIGLPDISGFEVLKQLLLLDPTSHVVMLSGMNNDMYIKKCREMGAKGFLSKPYQKENIQYYIEQFLELRTT